jgi:hypothetical protein
MVNVKIKRYHLPKRDYANAEKIYNAMSSPVHFEIKFIYFEKTLKSRYYVYATLT